MGRTINVYEEIAPVFWDVYDDLQAGNHSEYWEKGGRGSGKSSAFSLEIIAGMLNDRNANAIVYRRVGNTIKDSVFAQMSWACERLGIDQICIFRSSPYEIIFKPTGQRILFRGADDPQKSKSIKLKKGYFKYLWFEELSEFPGAESIRTIKQSVLRGADKAFTLCSYNPPKSAQSWVNEESLKHVESRLVHSSSYLDVPKEWLGEAFLHEAETLKATNLIAYKNEYGGEVTGTGGSVFDNVTVRKITDEEKKSLSYFYQGIDWGYFPDPFAWVRCAFDAKKRILYIIDEFKANKMRNYATFNAIKGRLHPDEPLTADSAEPKSIADFREYGARWIHGVVKGPGSLDYSMKWLATLAQIVIDEKCVEAKKEFIQYEFERDKEGKFVNAYVDANNHFIDATRYALYPVWRISGE